MRAIAIALVTVLLTVAGPEIGSGLAAPHYADPGTVRKRALRDVERRLQLAPLPPGARRISKAPKGSHLATPGTSIASKNFLDRGRIWTLPGTPTQAIDWIEAHPPAGLPLAVTNKFSVRGRTVVTELGYEWRELPNLVGARYLYFAIGTAPGGGTILRIDSQGVWILPHPATEVIPTSVRSLEVLRQPERGPSTRQQIDNARQVRRLAAMINRLPVTQPVEFRECGPGLPDDSTEVTLIFRDSNAGVVAEAHQQVPEGWCTWMALTIEGQPQRPLERGGRLLQKQLPLLS